MSKATIIKKSVLAGVLIAIGALFSMAAKQYGPVVQGLCFSVGLFAVLCTGAMLFTGGMLAIRAVWDKESTLRAFVKASSASWAWNLVGAVTIALMAWCMSFDATAIAHAKAMLPWHSLFIRAVLCNVMVCFAVWTYRETQRSGWERNRGASLVLDALASCLLPVACFVACGFEHSVADMLYMPLGWLQGAVSMADCVRVILMVTAGNVVGGIAFAWMVRE